jgi:5'-nucleotidase
VALSALMSRIRFVRVLLTNDDGIEAEGLQTLRRALLEVPGIELRVIAPDGNRSAMARSITTRRPLWVQEVDFGDGTTGFATDGTPVDCVRLAHLGLIDEWLPEMVVSGINHGTNIGDDITYSGTVAAALEAIVLGLPGIAVSQQSSALELDFRQTLAFDFNPAANFTARLVADLESVPLPEKTLLNVNFPGCPPEGVEVARLGRRFYRDELQLVESDPTHPARRRYRVYGEEASGDENERDTDITAVEARRVAITPLHFDLTHHAGVQALIEHDLARLLEEPTDKQP